MPNLKLEFRGTEKSLARLADLRVDAMPRVLSKALTDTAFNVRGFSKNELSQIFDRPTSYTLRSLIVKKAVPDNLRAEVVPTYLGSKGVDPQKYLKAEVYGGGRKNKRMENSLRLAGVLPVGMQTAIPRVPYPGSDDGHGNLKGSFIVMLLSYFQAFGEQGYRANTGRKKISRMADITRYSSLSNKKTYKTVRGVQFFVAGGDRADMRNKTRHLQPGIYAKSGTHGANIRPVVIFTRPGVYQPVLDFERLAMQAKVDDVFQRKVRNAIYLEWERR